MCDSSIEWWVTCELEILYNICMQAEFSRIHREKNDSKNYNGPLKPFEGSK